VLQKARACLFLGVPHRGSGLADWAKLSTDVVRWLSLGLAGNVNFVSILKKSSKDWVWLSDSFVERAESLFIRSFYETKKYGNVIVSGICVPSDQRCLHGFRLLINPQRLCTSRTRSSYP